jgi:GT2 family glycosyltransferase
VRVSDTDIAREPSDPRLELAEFDDVATGFDEPIAVREHFVTAILVAHDGSVWLPAVLTQLARQTRPLDAVLAVDTGSTDNSRELLTTSLGADRVLEVGDDHSFSAAVNLAAAQIPAGPIDAIEWIWLLHDDSAPSSDCLEQLLRAADIHPSAGILGPKILGWHDQRLLLEVGASVTGSGRRYTGLERREHDQGQHDGSRDVLSVSSAGMLIRRDLWERLRGFDSNLPLFRNDLDLCWRANRTDSRVLIATDAVLHHREASAHGRRAKQHDRAQQRDREAAVHVLLAQVPGWQRPFVGMRLFLGSSVRALAALIGKDFDSARDEFLGTVGALRKPGRDRAIRPARSGDHG